MDKPRYRLKKDGRITAIINGEERETYPNKPWLNEYGYVHRNTPCQECGEIVCDPQGIGHFRR